MAARRALTMARGAFRTLFGLSAFIGILSTDALSAQEPARLLHARLETRSAAGGLARALAAPTASPTWFGWSVASPSSRTVRTSSDDSNGWDGRCMLEGSRTSAVNVSDERGDSGNTLLFVKTEGGRPTRLRVFSDDCTVDAGGSAVVWLEDVRPSESVAWLEHLDGTRDEEREEQAISRDRAVMAIALHADPAADAALDRLSNAPFPEETRKKAVFWLGNMRGHKGWESLVRIAKSGAPEEVRKAVTFGLSQSPVPEALGSLMEMARRDESPRVRSQALFWLAQKAGNKAAAAIQDAIRDDPETEVKKKAVFALSQLPADQAVTELIRVARTNRNPEVRKQAFFWLGQTKDPRAMAYIEEVVTR